MVSGAGLSAWVARWEANKRAQEKGHPPLADPTALLYPAEAFAELHGFLAADPSGSQNPMRLVREARRAYCGEQSVNADYELDRSRLQPKNYEKRLAASNALCRRLGIGKGAAR